MCVLVIDVKLTQYGRLKSNIKKTYTGTYILYSAFESKIVARPIRFVLLERTTYEKRERVCRALLENREKEKVSDEQKSKEKKIERKKTVGKFRKSSLLEREPVRKKRILFFFI